MQQKENGNSKVVCKDGFCRIVGTKEKNEKKVWFDAITDTAKAKK